MAFILQKASNLVTENMERAFYRWGKIVAEHPYPVICTCLVVTALTSIGFINFRMEHQANLLWINSDSSYNIHEEWLQQHFKKNERPQVLIVKSENVLTPEIINKMYDVYQEIMSINSYGKTFDDICATVPIADIFQTKKRKKRQVPETEEYEEEYYDYSNIWDEYPEYDETKETVPTSITTKQRINFSKYAPNASSNETIDTKAKDVTDRLPENIYCDLVTTLSAKCIQSSLLDIWRYEENLIRSTTQQEILDAVNLLTKSPWFGYDLDYSNLLGGIERNATGHIVSAKTAHLIWTLHVPEDAVIESGQGGGLEIEPADKTTIEWEDQFINIALNKSTDDFIIKPNAVKSFSDVSSQAVFFDIYLMLIGYSAMFIYTVVMLGKVNSLEIKFYLSIAGIVSVFKGLFISVAIASMFNFPYTPMHAALPFLCLGIGIDDMFVIVQCMTNLKTEPEYDTWGLDRKLGHALRHAGVSITVTSATDVVAFGVGAVTQMPGLQSFCVCTAIALASIYVFQLTWFAAWLVIDERRKQNNRNGLIPCIVHDEDHSPIGCSFDTSWLKEKFWVSYETLTSSWVYKVLVILISGGLLSVGILGWTRIVHKFDPVLLLPAESYLRQWVDLQFEFYPTNGWAADLYSGPLDYNDLGTIEDLNIRLEDVLNNGNIIRGYDCWWKHFKKYVEEKHNFSHYSNYANENDFPKLLSEFLFSPDGARYKGDFNFVDNLECGSAAPNITASKCKVDYFNFLGPETHIPAKAAITEAIKTANSPYFFSHSKVYSAWETDEIIGFELMRNLLLSILCVAIITMLLLGNIFVVILVLVMVIATLVDIVGFLHFWGITIDILSAVNIVLAIGLCVDYAVHIAHAFLISEGSRQERATNCVKTIGMAVLNGGVTTFLALFFCSFSSAHVFQTFFKVFSLTVTFGLFHGLVLLPALLSIMGPASITKSSDASSIATQSCSVSASSRSESPARVVGIYNISANFDDETKIDKQNNLEPQWVNVNLGL